MAYVNVQCFRRPDRKPFGGYWIAGPTADYPVTLWRPTYRDHTTTVAGLIVDGQMAVRSMNSLHHEIRGLAAFWA